nr:immunoglobulin heavy chain junction region [Mus musculus]
CAREGAYYSYAMDYW